MLLTVQNETASNINANSNLRRDKYSQGESQTRDSIMILISFLNLSDEDPSLKEVVMIQSRWRGHKARADYNKVVIVLIYILICIFFHKKAKMTNPFEDEKWKGLPK